jgi:coproporphyrinogen III oxidase-like Fe-S oxidoreductase
MRYCAVPRHVYLHVPFCSRRCSYCDFSIAVRRDVPVDEYLAALEAELSVRFASEAEHEVDTIYLGGGTPSRLGGTGVARAVALVRRWFPLARGGELTVEANPEDVTAAAVDAWVAAGVNRLSLGSQSFDDRVLAWMHRTHDAQAIERAVATARGGGIRNLSLDLIFALPAELERDLDRDVERLTALEPDHVSLYGLTVESTTPLGRWVARGDTIERPRKDTRRNSSPRTGCSRRPGSSTTKSQTMRARAGARGTTRRTGRASPTSDSGRRLMDSMARSGAGMRAPTRPGVTCPWLARTRARERRRSRMPTERPSRCIWH